MSLSPLLRFFVEALEVGLELCSVDTPNAAAPDLHRRQIPGAYERVHLRDAHAEVGRNILESHESRLDVRGGRLRALGRTLRGHCGTIAPCDVRYLDLTPFAHVWAGS